MADRDGTLRAVGWDEYFNRLLIYVGTSLASDSTWALERAELELMAYRFDAQRARLAKGIHRHLNLSETRRAYLDAWRTVQIVRQYSPPNHSD